MDGIALSALVISVINALSHLHLRKVHALCFSSECSATPPTTPNQSTSLFNKEVIVNPPSPISNEKNITII
tara:strand:+ start:675 stop:887 length:213 start_codon:yes stop_codon:yes gene_type:complete